MKPMLTVVVAEGLAIVLLAVLVLGLLRSHGLILRALHELGAGLELEAEAGSSAPGPVPVQLERGVVPASRPATTAAADVVGTSLEGQAVTVPVSGTGRRTLLAFLSSGCSVCQTFWDEFSAHAQDVPGDARLAVVTKGPEQESVSRLRQLAGDNLEVVQSTAAWNGFAVPGSPYFVYVEDGVITGEGSSTTWGQVRDLIGQAVDDSAEARREAGRTGPGFPSVGASSAGSTAADRDDPVRMDRELLAAGVRPGHPSMYEHPERAAHPEHPDRSGAHDHAQHRSAGSVGDGGHQ